MDFNLHITDWELSQPFRISGHEWLNSRCLIVQLGKNGFTGRGEAQGVFYLGETAESIFEQANAIAIERKIDMLRTCFICFFGMGSELNKC